MYVHIIFYVHEFFISSTCYHYDSVTSASAFFKNSFSFYFQIFFNEFHQLIAQVIQTDLIELSSHLHFIGLDTESQSSFYIWSYVIQASLDSKLLPLLTELSHLS